MNLDTAPLADLVKIHNAINRPRILKFENRTKAKRRIEKLLAEQNITIDEAAAKANMAQADDEAPYGGGTIMPPAPGCPTPEGRVLVQPARQPRPAAWNPATEAADTRLAAQDVAAYQAAAQQAARDVATLADPEPAPAPAAPQHTGDCMVRLTSAETRAIFGVVLNNRGELDQEMTVTILEKLRTAKPVADKPAKAPREPREAGMTPKQRIIVELCSRPEGATGNELAAGCGWPTIAARTTCQKLADRFGFTLSEKPKAAGRGITFYMAPLQPLSIAA